VICVAQVFFEYYYNADNDKCMEGCPKSDYPLSDAYCTDLDDNTQCWCAPGKGKSNCYATETLANNFIAVRHFGGEFGNTLYAEYQTGDQQQQPINFDRLDFHELYNGDSDVWQMDNLYNKTSADALVKLHNKLRAWFTCEGDACP